MGSVLRAQGAAFTARTRPGPSDLLQGLLRANLDPRPQSSQGWEQFLPLCPEDPVLAFFQLLRGPCFPR